MDKEVPADRPAPVRRDKGAADMGTQVALGWVEEPPKPAPTPPPGPDPVEQANEAALQAALVDAGVTKTGRDEQVIDVLAKLDAADVEVVTGWLTSTKTAEPPPSK